MNSILQLLQQQLSQSPMGTMGNPLSMPSVMQAPMGRNAPIGTSSLLNDLQQQLSQSPIQPMGNRQTYAMQTPTGQNVPQGIVPQGQQMSLGDPSTLSGRIQEWLGSAEPDKGGLAQSILSGRSQPTMNDWADSVAQTATTGKPVSSDSIADERLAGAVKALDTLQQAEFERQKFGETQRHNLATEALTGERTAYLNRGGAQRPLPVQALKLIDESTDIIGTAGSINADLGNVIKTIDNGALDLGPMTNLGSQARNFTGLSSPNSRNYGSFMASLEKLRNDSLRLNKGVQTEGDSQRAWNELVKNINDEGLVRQRLDEIIKINERGANLQKVAADRIMMNYGRDPMDYSAYEGQQGAVMNQSSSRRQRLEELRQKAGQ